MNSFFASVHQALDQSLKGKPVIVCGDPAKRHGIILAASYEAKRFGIKTAMTNWEAQKVLPHGIYVKPNYQHYFDFSARIINIIKDFSPLVEPFSIDEAFVDITGCEALIGNGPQTAQAIKDRIKNEVDVMCSVGVGPNKLLAKMASNMQKPDGLTILNNEDIPKKLWPLPIKELFGIGSRTEQKLNLFNIHTIGDLAKFPVEVLEKRFGVIGRVLHNSANGIDDSPVDPHSLDKVKSIGHQFTLERDYISYEEIKIAILEIAEMVARRVRLGGYIGKTVFLTLKDDNFETISRAMTLPFHTDLMEDIYQTAVSLLYKNWTRGRRVRLIGISMANLVLRTHEQLDLLGEKNRLRNLNVVCDEIKERFGETSIRKGITLTKGGLFNGR